MANICWRPSLQRLSFWQCPSLQRPLLFSHQPVGSHTTSHNFHESPGHFHTVLNLIGEVQTVWSIHSKRMHLRQPFWSWKFAKIRLSPCGNGFTCSKSTVNGACNLARQARRITQAPKHAPEHIPAQSLTCRFCFCGHTFGVEKVLLQGKSLAIRKTWKIWKTFELSSKLRDWNSHHVCTHEKLENSQPKKSSFLAVI